MIHSIARNAAELTVNFCNCPAAALEELVTEEVTEEHVEFRPVTLQSIRSEAGKTCGYLPLKHAPFMSPPFCP